jgi:hypothetical protein
MDEDLPAQLNASEVEFLKTEANTGITFADAALVSRDPVRTAADCKNARKAYDAVLRYIPRVVLLPGDATELRKKMDILKSKLQQLGEQL